MKIDSRHHEGKLPYLVLAGIVLGALYWVLESVVDAFVFDKGTLATRLWSPDTNELWMRLSVIVALLALSVYAQVSTTRRLRLTRALEEREARLRKAKLTAIARRGQGERALRESEARVRAVLETVVDGIITTDEHGTIASLNRGAEEIFGHRADEVIDKNVGMLIPSADGKRHAAWLTDCLNAGEKQVAGLSREMVGRRKDGTTVPIDVAVSELLVSGRRMLTVVVRDISQHKRAENLLVAQKDVLEMIATGAPLPEVLDTVSRAVEEQSPGTLCSVLVLDETGTRLRHGAAPSLPESYNKAVDGILIGPRAGSCGTAAHRGETVVVSDIATDPLWADYRDLGLSHGLRACWSTPIFSSYEKVLGAFAMYYREPREPGPGDLELIKVSAHLAGIAIERRQAEAALWESEQRYRTLTEDVLDSSAVGILILDADFHVVWINQALERYFGLRREDVIGRDKRQLIREQIQDRFEDPQGFAQKVLATYDDNSYVENFECHVLAHGQQEERWLEHWSQPIRSGLHAGGRIEHYYDITRLKRADEAVRTERDFLARLLDLTRSQLTEPQDFCDHMTNAMADGLDTSMACVSVIEGDELRVISLWDHGEVRHGLVMPLENTPCRDVKKQRRVCSFRGPLDTQFPDDPCFQERSLRCFAGAPMFGHTGEVMGVASVLSEEDREFTPAELTQLRLFAQIAGAFLERYETEKDLKNSQERLQTIFDGATQGIYLASVGQDGEYVIESVNPALLKMTGIDRMTGTLEECLGPEIARRVRERLDEVVATKKPVVSEEVMELPAGRRVLSVSRHPIFGDNSSVVRIIGFLEDVTERKRTESLLRRYEQIVSATTDHMAFVDRSYVYQAVNDTYLRAQGKSRNEIVGHSVEELFGPRAFEETIRGNLDRALAGEEVHYQWWARFPVTGRRFMDVTYYPYIEDDGSVSGVVVSARDITKRKQAEEALQESERALSTLMSNLPGMAYRCRNDRHWTMEFVSEGCLELTGHRPEDLVDNKKLGYADLIHPDDQEAVWDDVQAGVRERRPFQLVYRITAASGEQKWVWEQGRGVFSSDGELVALEGFITNITERKRAEEALQYRAEFEELITAISTQFINLAADEIDKGLNDALREIGRFAGVDRAYIFQFSDDGQTMDNTHEWCAEGIEPQMARLRGLALDAFPWFAERIKQPDVVHVPRVGALPAEAGAEKQEWGSEDIKSLINVPMVYGGRLAGFLGLDSVRSEKQWPEDIIALLRIVGETFVSALQRQRGEEERKRLSTAVEQAAEAILITDAKGTIQYVNPAFERITQYTREEALGRNPRILKSGKHPEAFYRELWDTLTRGEVWSGHFINRRKDGTLYEEESTISPIRDASGVITNYVAVKHDVTHEVELENQLRQAQKMEAVGTLASGIAHDFNNLLTALFGHLTLAAECVPSAHEAAPHMSKVEEAAGRCADLVRSLLTFTRQLPSRRVPTDLSHVVSETVELLEAALPETIRLDLRLPPDLPHVLADVSQMRQVVLNLCVNARDAMPEGGAIVLETEATTWSAYGMDRPNGADAAVRLSVYDTGCGMDAETRSRAFEPFFSTKKQPGQGTGLGLSIVYGIVKQHGGHIRIDSQPGEGTCVHVMFPALGETQLGAAAPEKTGEVTRSGRPTGPVLFADDEALLLHANAAFLRVAGLEVVCAEDGEEALRQFREHPHRFSVVVVDQKMPKMSGLQCLRAIRELDRDVPALLTTGYVTGEVCDACEEVGHVELVEKPFRPADLLRRILQTARTEGADACPSG